MIPKGENLLLKLLQTWEDSSDDKDGDDDNNDGEIRTTKRQKKVFPRLSREKTNKKNKTQMS